MQQRRGAEPTSDRASQGASGDAGAIRHGVMLQLNEQLVLDYVHTHGTTTRPEIASSLGLSAATVSRIIRRLVGRDLVRQHRASVGGGCFGDELPGGRGRGGGTRSENDVALGKLRPVFRFMMGQAGDAPVVLQPSHVRVEEAQ